MRAIADSGSFRDPAGHVFERDGRIFRTVNEVARDAYESVRNAGVIGELSEERRLIASNELRPSDWPLGIPSAAYLLEHERIPFISYPYEWSFAALKAAALHHLDLQLSLLEREFVLSDASAYNVQFIGSQPIFIDTLSIRPYREREFWQGHRQFCQQFLNPLLLRSALGVAHNAWYRGNLEGIPTTELSRLLSTRHKLSWNMLTHVVLQARLEARAIDNPRKLTEKAKGARGISRLGYQGILIQLRKWIARLRPAREGKTVWADYAASNTYSDNEREKKKEAVKSFSASTRPKCLIDLGCNTGDFSIAALEGGAQSVIGFDFDQNAVDAAFHRSVSGQTKFLPLWLDASNPSPDQGWYQSERQGFAKRAKADAVIALAFEHHLAIGKNIPLPQVVKWLVDVAPTGLLEFVPKEDSTIQRMLTLREDIFSDYSELTFARELEQHARIVGKKVISDSGRTLFLYER